MSQKLTMVRVNGLAVFAWLPVDFEGKVKVSIEKIREKLGIEPGVTIYFE